MNKKANALITTLFIMLVIAIIVLIISKFTLNLIEISSENHKYYKAYYIANAWVELELLKLKFRWIWFEDKIEKTSQTVTKNFISSKKESKSLETVLVARWNIINWNPYSLFYDPTNNSPFTTTYNISSVNCSNTDNFLILNPGDTILLWLFYDKPDNWTFESKYSWNNYDMVRNWQNFTIYGEWKVFVWLQTEDNNSIKKNVYNLNNTDLIQWKNISTDINSTLDITQTPFIVVTNLDTQQRKYCFSSDWRIVSNYAFILSKWRYKDRHVQIRAIKYHKRANFVAYHIYDLSTP